MTSSTSGSSHTKPVGANLRLEDVKVHFGGVRAVDGVSFSVEPGVLCGLVGPNGSGKTTLVNAISALVPLTEGSIALDGSPMAGAKAPTMARAGVRRTFQSIRLLEDLTILENVMLGLDSQFRFGDQFLRLRWSIAKQRSAKALARRALKRVGMASDEARKPSTLPYGHQRRVEIARALVADPRLLLLDEPVAGMANEERLEIAELLLELRSEGLTQVLIEHDLGLVARICDQLVVIDFGHVIASGVPKEVTRLPHVREAYLGHKHKSVIGG